ncbi:MAG: anhydro-N-acetylmuramic acid kinase [Chitinophagaceae bacterium]
MKRLACCFSYLPNFTRMLYNVIGLMSGSSLDGLDIAYVQLQETAGRWNFEILHADCYPYSSEWASRLSASMSLSAIDYLQLHSDYGHYTGQQVNRFIKTYQLEHQVHLVASHGHTSFHYPASQLTAQLGDGAAIAAETGLSVVSDLRAMDVAFFGQGAPLVPTGEKHLLGQYKYLLNIGGIANLSIKKNNQYFAFDVCAANRVLNMLVAELGLEYDDNGKLAASGSLDPGLLLELNKLSYYGQGYPKSLDNGFGVDTVFPIIIKYALTVPDALHTYAEHIAEQIFHAVKNISGEEERLPAEMLITGGGAFNGFLVGRLQQLLASQQITIVIPGKELIQYKEALIMGLLGVLRWREEYTVMSSVTGASRNSIGGALWLGGDA